MRDGRSAKAVRGEASGGNQRGFTDANGTGVFLGGGVGQLAVGCVTDRFPRHARFQGDGERGGEAVALFREDRRTRHGRGGARVEAARGWDSQELVVIRIGFFCGAPDERRHQEELIAIAAVVKGLHRQHVAAPVFQQVNVISQVEVHKGTIVVIAGGVGVVLRVGRGVLGGNLFAVEVGNEAVVKLNAEDQVAQGAPIFDGKFFSCPDYALGGRNLGLDQAKQGRPGALEAEPGLPVLPAGGRLEGRVGPVLGLVGL